MKIEYLLPGLVVAGFGFLVLFGLLASASALAKSKQLSAIGDIAAGRAGGGKRALLFLAFGMMFFGTCGVFGGVARSDGERAKACVQACTVRGYPGGRIGRPSEPADPKHPRPACLCDRTEALAPLEIPADELTF